MIRDIIDIVLDEVRPKYWALFFVAVFLLFISKCSYAALTDIKFGRYQIADSQWNVSACLYTTTCQIYSKQPGVMYKIPWTTGQWSWQSGQYVKFELSGNTSFPYTARVYNSDGTLAGTVGTGKIVNMGPNYFFFVGSDNNTGQLFSGSLGMSGTSGVSWTGTLNPTVAQADAYADSNYSVDPLSPGQTATNTPSSSGGGGSPTWPTSDGITNSQTTQKNNAKTRVANESLGNYIYIDEKIGSSNSNVTVEQSGSYNQISGLGGTTYAIIDGDNNTINIKQGSVSGKNLIEFTVTGNSNNLTLWQARNLVTGLGQTGDSGGHYTGVNITGSSNTLLVKQNNDGSANSGQFSYTDISGNSNQGVLKQIGNNEKTFFGVLSGNSNVFDVTQQNTGNHYFFLTLSGVGHNVTANQKDSGSHNATINLTNSGGASTVTLTQQGSTAQSINITQQCATLAGCAVSVTQGQ